MQSAKLGNYIVYFENNEEYHRIKREVWGANNYYIELEKEKPTIIDAGAHIGLTTLYFKKIYPESRIIALEPLPANARILRKNIYENQVEKVTIEEVALASVEGEQELFYDATETVWYSTAGFNPGGWTGDQTSKSIRVKTQKLSYYLQNYKPDLVKMDIEGAEEQVLFSAQNELKMCPNYLIEFHPVESRGMERIIKLLIDNGYSITVSKDGRVVPWQKARGLSLIQAQVLA